MARKNKGHFGEKHPGAQPEEKIVQAIRAQLNEGGLFCAIGFKIARDLSVQPLDVGRNADLLELPILKCQLGLFGYPPQKKIVKQAASVPAALEQALKQAAVDNRISCATIFAIAQTLKTPKMGVCAACEKMGIRVSSCQLGAF